MKTTYQQLETLVLPHLKAYKDDLLKHDRDILEVQNYKGPFLYGYRETGTDLLRMLPDFKSYAKRCSTPIQDTEVENWITEEIIWITGLKGDRNKTFFFFDGKKLISVTPDKANTIHQKHISKIIADHKLTTQQ